MLQGKTVVACTVLPDEAVDGDIPQPEHCVICTLEPGRTDQCSVTLTFEEDVTFTLISGDGPVCVTMPPVLFFFDPGCDASQW